MFTKNQIKKLQNAFACLKGTETCFHPDTRKNLKTILQRTNKMELAQLYNADIPVLSTSAFSTLISKFKMTYKQADILVATIKKDWE